MTTIIMKDKKKDKASGGYMDDFIGKFIEGGIGLALTDPALMKIGERVCISENIQQASLNGFKPYMVYYVKDSETHGHFDIKVSRSEITNHVAKMKFRTEVFNATGDDGDTPYELPPHIQIMIIINYGFDPFDPVNLEKTKVVMATDYPECWVNKNKMPKHGINNLANRFKQV